MRRLHVANWWGLVLPDPGLQHLHARSTLAVAQAAKHASRVLATLSEAERNNTLLSMADAVERARAELLAANQRDMAEATGELNAATISRLRLSEQKLDEMAQGIRSVAALPDPLGRVLQATELDNANPDSHLSADGQTGLHLRKVTVPLGVLLTIFEARPDAVTQIASLALKSGNAVILKPGREVEHTAMVLTEHMQRALREHGLPDAAITFVLGREKTNELLSLHSEIDMVIPRGSKQLVEHVQANTRIPVLGHAEGVCHIYVDSRADLDLAVRVIADSKIDYPAACNAVETVLVHREIAATFVPMLGKTLRDRGVQLHGDEEVKSLLPNADLVRDWHTEYGDLALSLAVVGSVEEAIAHIHAHGSSHTESILTEDAETAEKFLREVDAAGVFHNCSTRFADGFRYGFGAEVGVSTSKVHARGPVGLEGLTTYKYVLRGHGHVAGDYRGPNARQFTHRPEELSNEDSR